jgi:hypothetical protein
VGGGDEGEDGDVFAVIAQLESITARIVKVQTAGSVRQRPFSVRVRATISTKKPEIASSELQSTAFAGSLLMM